VKVYDMNSRRGPTREIVRVFTMPTIRDSQMESLDIETLRGQVVTIELAAIGGERSCIGWSDLRIE
jgi:hypothetical protein